MIEVEGVDLVLGVVADGGALADANGALLGLEFAADQAGEGGLAAAVDPDQGHLLASVDVEIGPLQHPGGGIAEAHLLDVEHLLVAGAGYPETETDPRRRRGR